MTTTAACTPSLNDFADRIPGLAEGTTEVYFLDHDHLMSRDYIFGLPVMLDMLGETHRLLGKIQLTDLEEIFFALQGEIYSPNGEARALIQAKFLCHTSMSVGDVVKVGEKYFVVADIGFTEIVDKKAGK